MPTTQIKSGAPGLYPVAVDTRLMSRGAGVGILVTVPSGVTTSYTVQVSGDPSGAPITNWNPHDTLGTAQTTSANGNIEYPCTWIGLNIASISGGSIVMNIVQTDQGLAP